LGKKKSTLNTGHTSKPEELKPQDTRGGFESGATITLVLTLLNRQGAPFKGKGSLQKVRTRVDSDNRRIPATGLILPDRLVRGEIVVPTMS